MLHSKESSLVGRAMRGNCRLYPSS